MDQKNSFGFTILLVTLILLLILDPLFSQLDSRQLLKDFVFSAVFLAAIKSIFQTRKLMLLAILVATPGLLARWGLYALEENLAFLTIGYIADVGFLSLCAIVVLIDIVRTKTISFDIICGSISGYFLIGFAFARLFLAIDQYSPDSFSLPVLDEQDSLREKERLFIYFSFVTLTTLGYGDMLPRGDVARSFAILEAVLGQMYIAVLVAALVGIFISQRKNG